MQKKAPKSSKNEMLILGLRSTSDNWPNDLSDKSQSKCEKMKKIGFKNKMTFWFWEILLHVDHCKVLLLN